MKPVIKDYETLASRFDMVDAATDMPVSEEVLGAYLEGTLDSDTAAMLDTMVFTDPSFADFTEGITEDFDPAYFADDSEYLVAEYTEAEIDNDINGLTGYDEIMHEHDVQALSDTNDADAHDGIASDDAQTDEPGVHTAQNQDLPEFNQQFDDTSCLSGLDGADDIYQDGTDLLS